MIKCPNCQEDHWENIDNYRFKDVDKKGKEINMCLCTNCGMVSYPDRIKDKEKMLEHYRKDYRPAPTIQNSFTGQRKNGFHYHFLKDLFDKWTKEEKTNPVICDVGCAFGMSLSMFKQFFPEADLNGTELTQTMRNVAFHEFGFRLTEEIDESKKYDLIMSYKVLEHMIDPLEELHKYARLLKEDGRLYISVPTWFNTMSNFGLEGFDLEYYYDPNHVNVWTLEMFESLLLRAGLKIIKKDHLTYGDTYLCEYSEKHKSEAVFKEDYFDMKAKLEKIKKAFELYTDYKFEEATKLWPNYPAAWISKLEMNRKIIGEKGYEYFKDNYIKPFIKACTNGIEPWIVATDYAMRSRQWEDALRCVDVAMKIRPNNPISLNHLIKIYKEQGAREKDEQKKQELFTLAKEAAIVLHNSSAENRTEAVNELYFISSLLPIPEVKNA
jgi:SAM-dependent methyltransferase